jgi:3-oxoacyl-[acyl-carrier protein] reductase
MSKKLSGKVALVTGGSRGIGAATALALANEGADVAISYSSSAEKANALVKEIEKKGVRAHAFKADQADSAQVTNLVKSVATHFGKLDILVNNAGVFVMGAAGDPTNDNSALEKQFAVNIGGVSAAVNAAAPLLSEGGRIINIGSVLGERSPSAGMADYSATKAAVAAFSRGWARDFGARGITVNTIQPGPINTDMNPEHGDFAEAQKTATALGRYGQPREIANAVTFLAGPGASFITGTTINVDGGYNA